MIQAYFSQVKSLVDRYAKASFVLDSNLSFELRPGDQGYVTGVLLFIDGSSLHFREFLDATDDIVDKLTYSYHYQDTDASLIFRYDNALHRPLLPSREHKHSRAGLQTQSAPMLEDVLLEVAAYQSGRYRLRESPYS